MFNNDDQLKAYLKSKSRETGISINNIYNTYFSRVLLQRISKIGYGKLAVKGSFSLLVHLNKPIRPITDIDLVSTEEHNEPLLTLYRAMYDSNDGIEFDLKNLPKKTRTGIYKLSLEAKYGKIVHSVSIDFMESSKTLYDIDYKKVPALFKSDTNFYVCTPNIEEHLAEKLCIVVESIKDDVLNTRVKDFYDIYKLNGGKYDEEKMKYYFKKMIKDRNKIDPSLVSTNHLNPNFISNHSELWNSMSQKYEFLDQGVPFDEAVELTKEKIEYCKKK